MLGSVGLAIYGLILYLYNFNEAIKSYKPFWKFFSIKIALFLSIWQQIILKLLKVREWIELQGNEGETINSEDYIDHLLVALEMFVLAVVARYTFSYEDFHAGRVRAKSALKNFFRHIPKILYKKLL